jgi:hypothetical protein
MTAFVQPSLVLTTLGVALLAALSFRFGFHADPVKRISRLQGAFLVFGFMLLPGLVITLGLQATARGRLERLGVSLPDRLGAPQGIAVGVGSQPTWLFATAAAPEEILGHYQHAAARGTWEVVRQSDLMIVLARRDERLAIAASSSGHVAFTLSGRPSR